MEKRNFVDAAAAQFKMLDDGPGEFSGYASSWGNADRVGDVIQRGAFTAAIPGFLRDGFIPMAHNWEGLPVAYPISADEDAYGLRITARFHSTPAAQEARTIVRERLESGKYVGLSIGFSIGDSESTSDGGRLIKSVGELFETSIVAIGCNPKAVMTVAKGFEHHIGAPRAGASLEDQSEAVLAAVEEYAERLKGLYALRVLKEGRVLSAANRERMRSLHETCGGARSQLDAVMEDLQGLLDATEPKPKADEGALDRARLEAEALRLSLAL